MAALLPQVALQPPHPTTYPHHPWMHSSPVTSILSPPHAALSRRRRTPAGGQLHAAGNGTPAADSSKKTSRKEKQQQQQRPPKREEQQHLLLKESLVEAAREKDGGGKDDDELPREVFDRILKCIMSTVGILNVYDALRRGVDVPSWVELLTILLSFGTSTLGITYGTLSPSRDPEKEGPDGRTNWPELWKEEFEKDEKK